MSPGRAQPRAVVTLMVVGGVWSAFINLTVFGWSLDQGGEVEHAMTLCFVTLVLVQFFKAYNFRSDRVTVLRKPFANKWLNLAVLWEMLLLIAIVYIPALHEPFGTRNLTVQDRAISIGMALTVMPVLELAKWMERRGWFGRMA